MELRDECLDAGVAFFFKRWGCRRQQVRRPSAGRAGMVADAKARGCRSGSLSRELF